MVLLKCVRSETYGTAVSEVEQPLVSKLSDRCNGYQRDIGMITGAVITV